MPVPAIEGVKTLEIEFTPEPEYVPPNGIPPLSLIGLALIVVIVSKQEVNETLGAKVPLIMIFAELAGLPVTQARLEIIIQ
jgi:hypothetical protein